MDLRYLYAGNDFVLRLFQSFFLIRKVNIDLL